MERISRADGVGKLIFRVRFVELKVLINSFMSFISRVEGVGKLNAFFWVDLIPQVWNGKS